MRLIDADAMIEYLHEFRCKDCDRRKGMKKGKYVFCYEIGDAPCRACDIGDMIDLLDEYILLTTDVVHVVRCKDCKHLIDHYGFMDDGYCNKMREDYNAKLKPKKDWFCADGERKD